MNKILTIIVSYNFEPWISKCISSLQQSKEPTDVIVLDNGSKDHTIQRLQNEYPWVKIVDNHANLGFGKANNIGMEMALKAGYEAVFLLNQDAWVAPDTIGSLSQLAKSHPEYGILSPTQLTGNGDKMDPGFAAYVEGCIPKGEICDIDFVNAATWFIPCKTIRKIGFFSPLFYHYGEDKDYVNRLHYHGLKIGYAHHLTACHDREYRPYNQERFLRTEMVYHLSQFANINLSYYKAFGLGPLACIKKMIQQLIKGHFTFSMAYLKMFILLLSRSVAIYKTRKRLALTLQSLDFK